MLNLSLAILALFAAPLIFSLIPHKDRFLRLIDGFIFVAIGGMILIGILPETYHSGGWPIFLFLIGGMILPTVSERLLHSVRGPHSWALILGVLGIFLHAITDGAALSASPADFTSHDHHKHFIELSVILHRIPISLMVWWFVKPHMGKVAAYALLGLIALGTLIGYGATPYLLNSLHSYGFAWFQAFVVGSLIHVILHRMHAPNSGCAHTKQHNWAEGLGNLAGLLLLVSISMDHNHFHETAWLHSATDALLELSLESAPALLFAYIAAGLALAFLPASYVNWMSSGRSLSQSLRGMLVGLPLPVCSCGVVPLYHTLIQKGAKPAAALAFLIATPELGLDAILISLPLLGETMTVYRVLAAAILAIAVGFLIGRITPIRKQLAHGVDSEHERKKESWQARLTYGMREGLGDLVDHTGPWIVAGLLIAAAIYPLISAETFAWLPGWAQVPFFAVLGMPVYVCASGATPLIAVFLVAGVSPGAALAFLLTGPATNITTFGVLSQLHGRKVAFLFGLSAVSITIVLGYLTNWMLPGFQPLALGEQHAHSPWYQWFALVLLIGLFGFSIFRRGLRAFVSELFSNQSLHHHDHDHHDHDGHGHNDYHHDHGHGHHDDHQHHDEPQKAKGCDGHHKTASSEPIHALDKHAH